MTKTFIISLFLLISSIVSGSKVDFFLEETNHYLTENQYDLAAKSLKNVFSQDTILPDISTFYLGVILFHKHESKSSELAFLKFIELTGDKNELFDSAVVYLNDIYTEQYFPFPCKICDRLGPSDSLDTCTICSGTGLVYYECNICEGEGEDVCQRCNGNGVLITRSSLGISYNNCHICGGEGMAPCHQCHGTGKEEHLCKTCQGMGITRRKRVCNHVLVKQ